MKQTHQVVKTSYTVIPQHVCYEQQQLLTKIWKQLCYYALSFVSIDLDRVKFCFASVCLELWSLDFEAWLPYNNFWWMSSANFKTKRTAVASRGFLATARLSGLRWFPRVNCGQTQMGWVILKLESCIPFQFPLQQRHHCAKRLWPLVNTYRQKSMAGWCKIVLWLTAPSHIVIHLPTVAQKHIKQSAFTSLPLT